MIIHSNRYALYINFQTHNRNARSKISKYLLKHQSSIQHVENLKDMIKYSEETKSRLKGQRLGLWAHSCFSVHTRSCWDATMAGSSVILKKLLCVDVLD
jgi:hypothetical protein